MKTNKEYAKCIKDFYASLPHKVAIDNNLKISPTQMYILFEKGKEYEISHEYKTSEEDSSYFRYVASDLKYNVNNKKNVYEKFATRENKNSSERMFDFNEFFEMNSNEKKLEEMNLYELEQEQKILYTKYQNESIFSIASQYLPRLKKCEELIEALKKEISEPEDNSHLN